MLVLLLAQSASAAAPAVHWPTPSPRTDRSYGPPGQCADGAASRPGSGWTCTWSDEFDGTTLTDTWNAIPYGLGSACLFDDPEYVQVADGLLRLTAKRLPTSHFCTQKYGLEYGGGGIQTQGAFAQRYGRFEMRAQLPPGAGYWPAFWLLPDDNTFDGEIDILEVYGGRSSSTGDVTVRAPAAGSGPHVTCDIAPDYSSGFHMYVLEWEPGRMRFFYDDVECADISGMSRTGTAPPALPATFDKPYYILLDLAVQPYWPPDEATPFPGTMLVDYVRVWAATDQITR